MINRNYLPYKSAREYVDSGMAKWAGFILSDHSFALSSRENTSSLFFNNDDSYEVKNIELEEFLMLLSQAYINKLTVVLNTKRKTIKGKIYDFAEDYLYLSCNKKTEKVQFNEITQLGIIKD